MKLDEGNRVFILGMFGVIIYIAFILCTLTTLGVINQSVKKIIFEHYGVPYGR